MGLHDWLGRLLFVRVDCLVCSATSTPDFCCSNYLFLISRLIAYSTFLICDLTKSVRLRKRQNWFKQPWKLQGNGCAASLSWILHLPPLTSLPLSQIPTGSQRSDHYSKPHAFKASSGSLRRSTKTARRSSLRRRTSSPLSTTPRSSKCASC